ncbi:hypothetical protein INT43_006517 [Umbelopsis isabellina]|uniref:Uncharacterized protein n=1 Tax=Mortierella isabellina TaxID=91625 RepID=A0A8H7Q2J8_MORIS|nr:hypothetical protein INT43_006517 [Umbelopsis isabellina]
MRDASKQTKVTKTTSIDVATLFGNASSVQQTSVQTTDTRNVSLDQLFSNASLNAQPAPPVANPVGKSVNLAELFQTVNPPPKPQNVVPTPQNLSINDLFSRAAQQQSQQSNSMPMPMPMPVPMPVPMPAPMPNAPATSHGASPAVDPAVALLNTLRGGVMKTPDAQQHYSPQQAFQQQPQQPQQYQPQPQPQPLYQQPQQQQQQQPNPAMSLLDILKGAQPKREPAQEPAVTMQNNLQSAQQPVSNTPLPSQSPPVQQPTPQTNQSPTVLNGTRKPSTNSLLALLQGSNISKPNASGASTPQSQSMSPAMNAPSPTVKSASPQASTSKPSLLDTLMGAGPAKSPSIPPAPISTSPVRQTSSPSVQYDSMSPSRRSISGAPPLELNQAQELAHGQLAKRMQSVNVLSKPEFIQQFLNIIQSDATFLDTLYSDYVKQHPGTPSHQSAAQSPQYFGALYPGMSHQ